MRGRPLPQPTEEAWTAALIAAPGEGLIAVAKHYLGPLKTPYDKRELVAKLASFLRQGETGESILALLDPLDAKLLGSSLLLGPVTEDLLRTLFAGELPLFDLGLRLANLQDRLLLFRVKTAGDWRLAVNPILAPLLAGRILEAGTLFGLEAAEGAAKDAADGADSALASGASRASARGGGRGAARGGVAEGEIGGSGGESGAGAVLDASLAISFFAVLHHDPEGQRKGGGLTKKGFDRARSLFVGLEPGAGELFERACAAFAAAGLLSPEEDGRLSPDPSALAALLAAAGGDLPYALAAATALAEGGGAAEEADGEPGAGADAAGLALRLGAFLARSLGAAPRGLVFSRGSLLRWLRTAACREGGMPEAKPRPGHPRLAEPAEARAAALAFDLAPSLLAAAERLGLVGPAGGPGGLAPRLCAQTGDPATSAGAAPAQAAPVGAAAARPWLVAEGSHALHLLPEADLEARRFVATLARPTAIGKAWSLELDRSSARRAFATGITAAQAQARLEAYAGRPLPQSLAFSLRAWEEEYRALRLYRGTVLVADERLSRLVEGSPRLAALVAERLAPGVFLVAGLPGELEEALREAGLEAPPETHYAPGSLRRAAPSAARASAEAAPTTPAAPKTSAEAADGDQGTAAPPPAAVLPVGAAARAAGLGRPSGAARRADEGPLGGLGYDPSRPRVDPEPRKAALRAAARAAIAKGATGADSGFGAPAAAEASSGLGTLAELQPALTRELEERLELGLVLTERQLLRAEAPSTREEASGLDYAGKARIAERALRNPGDRLEVLYKAPGEEAPRRYLLRPARLEKSEKGLVLEAEDLATGGSFRASLGALSSLRRLRASRFGEER